MDVKNFWKRTVTGILLVTVIVGTLLLGVYPLSGLCFLINVLGLLEFYRMFRIQNVQRKASAVLLSAYLFVSAVLVLTGRCNASVFVLAFPLVSLIFMAELAREPGNAFVELAFIFMGIIYVTVPFILLIASAFMTGDETGAYRPEVILGYMIMLWANDSGAFVFGTLFGKRRLAPRVSPNKTWEGSAGGALLVVGIAYLNDLFIDGIPSGGWYIIGAIVVVAGTLGDLVKSLMKRTVHIKDSGNVLPGHGGILDRFDSLIGSIPFVASYLILVV
ncbi:MAG TPA: phosphatidate cytidylyltransferase [Chryseosolibacter sp.]